MSSSSGLDDKTMKASIFSLVLALTSAKPQFEALQNAISTLAGDFEQAPYTTLKEFDVGFWKWNTLQGGNPT